MKRMSELHVVPSQVTFQGNDVVLCYCPEFRAKTEMESNPLPRHFIIKTLTDFVGSDDEEHMLCPVRALWFYLDHLEDVSP